MPFKNARKTSVTRTGGTRRARAATTRTKRSKRSMGARRTGKSRTVGGKKTRRRKRTKRGGVYGVPPTTPYAATGATTVAPVLHGKHAPPIIISIKGDLIAIVIVTTVAIVFLIFTLWAFVFSLILFDFNILRRQSFRNTQQFLRT